MQITATELRKDLFNSLDQVIETGIPLEITRKGHTLRVISDEPPHRLKNLVPHHTILGDAEALAELSVYEWSNNTQP
ncbi:MAG: type II toxin-antitoxin system prevent-host-death family antitoxin [Gammaproteobacteria bacterium]|jgi:prevent-host-death family protein|nr:type II toxin-antitoxin system prevent-host-death family antitoxin [Gammaproteobacteria bacterium]MBT4607269.1 type II toxin-antitoxin system prevent-host-death family antitoxin [Thiotrichales bacterium]MBT3472521.1 type II toxin-antitoxin system prevent-host-death family antitoxin [Gammaproteobacteria bacterium]MBT3966751.1 type II toxin-antitoxin system prevent-host-death family antitoxin [Gammaproteobacteria bacterium]MBT4081023.1 type II toxin-antitoxin system prevent-host-death family a